MHTAVVCILNPSNTDDYHSIDHVLVFLIDKASVNNSSFGKRRFHDYIIENIDSQGTFSSQGI